MRSMYSGVSGLNVHQAKMDVIGNNIANVNTTAYKGSTVTFSEVFSQTVKGATGPSSYEGGKGGSNPQQVGLGVNLSSIDINMAEGAAKRTDNPLDLKIEGDGFFVVQDESGLKYTRAGAFRIDSAGNLVTSSGLKVCGWEANSDNTDIIKAPVKPLAILKPEYAQVEPEKTTKLAIEGNWDLKDGGDYAAGTGGIPIIVSFYDSLGYKYTGQMTARFDTTDSKWKIKGLDTLKDEKGEDVIASGGAAVAPMTFGTEMELEFDATGAVTGTTSYDMDFSGVLPFQGVKSTVGDSDSININFDNVTQYQKKTSTNATTVDGRKSGSITGFSVGGDGKITGRYSNGQSKLLGQISLAQFKNPAGLAKVGNNMFIETANSGAFNGVGVEPGTGGSGINSGVLEMSNVDLSKEFTEMITTQRGFQANSRIITASDEILQELVNLKR